MGTAACMAARRRKRNGGTAAFRSDEADIGLRLLPRARPSSSLTLTSRSARGRKPVMHSHGGVHGSSALSDGATTMTARRPLPWLGLRQWVVSEVEEVTAEIPTSGNYLMNWSKFCNENIANHLVIIHCKLQFQIIYNRHFHL